MNGPIILLGFGTNEHGDGLSFREEVRLTRRGWMRRQQRGSRRWCKWRKCAAPFSVEV